LSREDQLPPLVLKGKKKKRIDSKKPEGETTSVSTHYSGEKGGQVSVLTEDLSRKKKKRKSHVKNSGVFERRRGGDLKKDTPCDTATRF